MRAGRIADKGIADIRFGKHAHARSIKRLAGGILPLASMACALTATAATRWIQNDVADAIVAAICNETGARMEIASALLPPGAFPASLEDPHL